MAQWNNNITDYISSVIPKDLKKGEQLIDEGRKLGKSVKPVRSKYYSSRGFDDPCEFQKNCIKKGQTGTYCLNIGMATVQETLDACVELARWGEEVGIRVTNGLLLPSMQVGVPKEKRDSRLDTTAFMINTQKDYEEFNREEISMPLSNYSIGCPNSIEVVKWGLESGLPVWGSTSQISWDLPGCDNHKEDVENVVRALGIMLENKDYYPSVGCYVEDGLAACCVDTVAIAAYFLLEQYIYADLVGIPISPCFGALVSDIRTKIALMVVLSDFAKERDGFLSFVHGSTTVQWDHDIAANYGASAQEMLAVFLAEDHYKTGCNVLAVPATEAITVPTLQEIKDIIAATGRTKEFVPMWRDLMDWSEIDRRIHIIKKESRKMFHNVLDAMEAAGADIKDPAQMLMLIKDIDASLFESMFHPSVVETGEFKPQFPNDMGQLTMDLVDEAVEELHKAGYTENTLKGKSVIVGSTDVHAYGVRFVNQVLTAMGARVHDIGVDNSPQSMVDMAVEAGVDLICASTHSGNALGIGNYFEEYISKEERNCYVVIGGILTSILPGHSEPSEVSGMLNKNEHILATNDMVEQVKRIAETIC